MSDFQFQAVQKRPIMSDELFALRAIDAVNKELMERNAIRIARKKEEMGVKYVLHPSNAPRKQIATRVLK